MSHDWLHLRFSAPLISFGGVAIDHVGRTRDYPSASALTGLLANALGYRREESARLQSLQDRMIFGVLIVTQGRIITDNQNAKLEKSDIGWTTTGTPEKRYGDNHDSPHRRRREYLCDHDCRVVLRLSDAQDGPSLSEIATALDRPARPIFIGRKTCLPSAPLLSGWLQADDLQGALRAIGLGGRALWPSRQGDIGHDLPDLRNWHSGLHTGSRRITEEVLS